MGKVDRVIIVFFMLFSMWHFDMLYKTMDRTDKLNDAVQLLASGLMELKDGMDTR